MDPIRFGHLKTSHPSLYEALKVLDEGFEKKHADGHTENAALKALLGADTISDNHAKVLKAIITHTSSANNLNSDRAIKLCLQVDDITNAATKILIDVVSSASATDGLDSNKLFRHFLTFQG